MRAERFMDGFTWSGGCPERVCGRWEIPDGSPAAVAVFGKGAARRFMDYRSVLPSDVGVKAPYACRRGLVDHRGERGADKTGP